MSNRMMNVGLVLRASGNVTQYVNEAGRATDNLRQNMAKIGLQRAAIEQIGKLRTDLGSAQARALELNAAAEKVRAQFVRGTEIVKTLQERLKTASDAGRGIAVNIARIQPELTSAEKNATKLGRELATTDAQLAKSSAAAQTMRERLHHAQAEAMKTARNMTALEEKMARSASLAEKFGDKLGEAKRAARGMHQGSVTDVATLESALQRAQRLSNGGELAARLAERVRGAQAVGEFANAMQRAEKMSVGVAKELYQARSRSVELAGDITKASSALMEAEQKSAKIKATTQQLRAQLELSTNRAAQFREQLARSEMLGAANVRETKQLTEQMQRAEKMGELFKTRLGEATDKAAAMRREVEQTEAALKRAGERAREVNLNANATSAANAPSTLQSLAAHETALQYSANGRALQESGAQMRSSSYGTMVGAAIAGYGAVNAAKPYSDFEYGVRDVAITGELNLAKEVELAKTIRSSAVKFNQRHSDLMLGVNTLVANGMSVVDARVYTPLLAKKATATDAGIKDLSNLIVSLQSNFNIQGEAAMNEAINAITIAGKSGSFEIKDMAKHFPELGAQMKSFGSTGMKAVRELAAALVVGRAVAASPDEAATNARNWFSQMTATQTSKAYAEMGINLERSMATKVASGMSAMEASISTADEYIDKVVSGKVFTKKDKRTGKVIGKEDFREEIALAKASGNAAAVMQLVERFGLSKIFQDSQAVTHYLGQRAGKKINHDVIAASSSEVRLRQAEEDFARRMDTLQNQMKAVGIASHDLMIGLGAAALAKKEDPQKSKEVIRKEGFGDIASKQIVSVTEYINANQRMVQGVLITVGALAALTVGVMALKFLAGGAMGVAGGAMRLWGFLSGKRTAPEIQKVFVVNMRGRRGRPPPRPNGRGLFDLLRRSALGQSLRRAGNVARLGMSAAASGAGALLRGGVGLLQRGGAAVLSRLASGFGGLGGVLRMAMPLLMNVGRTILMAMGPVGWAIGAVVGLAYAGYKLYKNWDTVGPKLKSAWESIKSEVGAGWAWYTSLPGRFLQAGKDVVAGFVGGIRAGAGVVKDSVMSMGSSALQSIKGVLGIQSPSRRFMEVGAFSAEGVAIGLGQRAQMVRRAASSLAETMLPDLSGKGAALASWASNAASTAGAGPHGAAPAVIHLHYAPQITVQGGGDGATLTGQIAEVLKNDQGQLLRVLEQQLARLLANQQRRAS